MIFRRDKHLEETPAGGDLTIREGASEEVLVARAQDLDTEAWTEIYGRHAEQVYAYIFYRIGDRPTAEDLTADVFVRAIAGIQRYEWRGTPLLAWLYRIAHNVTADYRKSAAKRAARETVEPPREIEERVDQLNELDERSDMMRALRLLTDDQQQVLILRFYGGMSNAQVAQVVGKPETAVKALQARGLRSLRRILTDGERQIA